MTFFDFFLVLVEIMVLAVVVVVANYSDHRRNSRMVMVVIGIVVLLNVGFAFTGVTALMSVYGYSTDDAESTSEAAAWGGMIMALTIAGLATALLFRPVRNRIAAIFPRFRPATHSISGGDVNVAHEIPAPQIQSDGEPLFPQMLNYYTTSSTPANVQENTVLTQVMPETTGDSGFAYRVRGFNPASYVHMLAIVFVVYLLGSQFFGFIVGGGLAGVAETYEEAGLDIWSLLANSLPLIVLPFLGVGLGMRRNGRQALERLGLGPVTGEGIAVSFGVTFMLFAMLFVFGVIWMTVVPEDVYEEQNRATNALSDSVDSVGIAFVLAGTAAVGEEIAFRGALQPVIGFWPTAIVFALTHTQYTLTPAWLLILVVAIAFGWIRQRYNTTVAILTHFWYNLFQLLLLFVMPEETTESFLRFIGLL